MKWMYLIVVLIIGGGLYYLTMRKPELRADSPQGAANVFINAALSGDLDKIRGMCAPSAVESAQRIAGEIKAAHPDPRSFKWQATAAHDPSLTALTALFQGRVLTIEMREVNGEYRIVAIDMAG